MKDIKNDRVLEELRRITRLLVYTAIKGQGQKEQIETLDMIGFQPKEIAQFLGTTSNTVRVTLVDIRKKQKVSKRKITTRAS